MDNLFKLRVSVVLVAFSITELLLSSCSTSLPTRASLTRTTTTDKMPTTASPQNTFKQSGGMCNQEACLFTSSASDEPPLGIATLRGFYQPNKRDFAMGPHPTPDIEVCDEFVITQGPDELIQWFTELIRIGNTANRITEQNQLAMSLYLETLGQQERDRIHSSTSTAPVEIVILVPTPPAYGPLSRCVTWIEILKVK